MHAEQSSPLETPGGSTYLGVKPPYHAGTARHSLNHSIRHTIIAAACALAASCGMAVAQTVPAAPSIDSLIPKGVTVTIGAMGTYQPKYDGAKTYEFQVLPIIKFDTGSSMGKRFDVRGLDDVSFAIVQSDSFKMGVLTGYRDGRDQSDSPRLRGLGDIDGGIVAGGFARYDMGPAYLRGSYHRQIFEDDNGGVFRFVLGTDYKLTDRVMLRAVTGLEAADRNYMQTYFGVSAAQSARSGLLPTYTPSGGLTSYRLGVGTDFEVIPTWTLTASADYIRYLGNASRSPIVEEADQFKVRLGVSKSFQMNLFGN
jgi:MipA family protein